MKPILILLAASAPYKDSPQTPVWCRFVMNDALVGKWEFFGWYRSPLELSEWLEEKLSERGFKRENRFMVEGTSTYRNFQFLFVYDWDADQIGKTYEPYCLGNRYLHREGREGDGLAP